MQELFRKEKTYKKLWIIAAAAFLLLLIDGILITNNRIFWFDDPIRNFFLGIRTESLTQFFILITQFGSTWGSIIVSVILLILPWTTLRFGVVIAVADLANLILYPTLKAIIQRERPAEELRLVVENGLSFPSGHSSSGVVLYGTLFLLLAVFLKKGVLRIILRVLCIMIIALIGTSRIYLGVHYPSDVLGGYLLGLFIVSILWYFYKTCHFEQKLHRTLFKKD